MDASQPQQHEGERGNTVDQVANLLMQEDAAEEETSTEEAVHRPNDDDLVDDSEQSEEVEARVEDVMTMKQTTPMSLRPTTATVSALAAELGLDADKLILSEDGDIQIRLKVNGKNG